MDRLLITRRGASVLLCVLIAILASGAAASRVQIRAACLTIPATIVGTEGDDVITGTPNHDVIAGLGGNDTIAGRGGGDTICAGSGDDAVSTTNTDRFGLDAVQGEAGNDSITMIGVAFHVASGGPGDDNIECGTSNSSINYERAPGPVVVNLASGTARGEGRDTLVHCGAVDGSRYGDTLLGGAASEVLTGHGGNDRISGGRGNDILVGVRGDDFLDGGPGIDKVVFFGRHGVTVNLRIGRARGEGSDRLRSIENVIGTSSRDVLVGDSEANMLEGKGANDRLFGRGAPDRLIGGGGYDFADGGAGLDFCVTEAKAHCP